MIPGDSSVFTDQNGQKFVAFVVGNNPDGTHQLFIPKPSMHSIPASGKIGVPGTIFDPSLPEGEVAPVTSGMLDAEKPALFSGDVIRATEDGSIERLDDPNERNVAEQT